MSALKTKLVDNVLHVLLNDQKTKNSLSLVMSQEIKSVLESATDDVSVLGLCFSASGRVFCSGGNLSDYAAMSMHAEGIAVNRDISLTLSKLAEFPKPTVAIVEGDCFGGGIELLSCFDVVYAAPHALFGFWQRRIGLTFGWGGGPRLVKRIPAKKLSNLALLTSNLFAEEALAIGLIDGVFPQSRILASAIQAVTALASLPKGPFTALRSERPLQSGVTAEAVFEELWWQDEHLKALGRQK